jgi:hypothetical protein
VLVIAGVRVGNAFSQLSEAAARIELWMPQAEERFSSVA